MVQGQGDEKEPAQGDHKRAAGPGGQQEAGDGDWGGGRGGKDS